MKLFFNSKRSENFKLTISDFKTETKKSIVSSTWVSPELLALLPKKPLDLNQNSSIEIKLSVSTVQLFQTSVDVIFEPDDVRVNMKKFIGNINNHLDWLSGSRGLIDAVIVRDLFELKNSAWLDKDETPIKEQCFIKKLKLISIFFSGDGSFELNFDDGDTFAGHTIVVSVTNDNKLRSAAIQG